MVSKLLSARGTVDVDARTNTLIIKDINSTIDEAVASVVSPLVDLSIGKQPDPEVVRRALTEVTAAGVTR